MIRPKLSRAWSPRPEIMDDMGEKSEIVTRPEHRSKWIVAIGAAIAGLCYAGLVGLLAIGLSGLGHGWSSASISCIGLILIPLASVACVYRHSIVGKLLIGLVLLGACITDVYLFIATRNEGFNYVERAWSALPVFLIAWAILWCAWQIAVAILFLRRIQFDLRTLLVVTAMISVSIAWVTYSLNWIWQRHEFRNVHCFEPVYTGLRSPSNKNIPRAPAALGLFGESGVDRIWVSDSSFRPRARQLFPEAIFSGYVIPGDRHSP